MVPPWLELGHMPTPEPITEGALLWELSGEGVGTLAKWTLC